MIDRDLLIRRALTPDADVRAPDDLGDAIYRSVLVSPQHRRRFALPTLVPPGPLAPAYRLALLILLLAALLGATLIVLSKPPVPGARLTIYHGGPERTGVMPGPGPLGTPVIAWDVPRGGAIGFSTMPIVADGRVFVVDDSGTVSALDEAIGDELWAVRLGGPIRSSPVLVDGLLIVGSDMGEVVGLRADDGREIWRFTASGPVSASLVAVDGHVYAGSEDATLHVLRAATGEPVWSIPTGGSVTRGPAVSDGVIYIGAQGGWFAAIDASTRQLRWEADLGDGQVGTPAVADGAVYVGRGIEALEPPVGMTLLAAADGSERWSFATPAGGQVHVGAVGERFVYAVAEDGNVYALEPSTGAIAWSQPTGARIATLAGLVGKVLYVANTEGGIHAFDAATGEAQWTVDVLGEPSLPAVINGRVFVGTALGRVVSIAGDSSE